MSKIKRIFLLLLLAIFLLLPLLSFAAEVEFKPQVGIPGTEIKKGEAITEPAEAMTKYFKAVYQWSIPAIGTIAVVMIIVAGFQWMLAAGNASKISQAKERITNALIGLVLVIGAYTILNFINPDLVHPKSLKLKKIERKGIDVESGAKVYERQKETLLKPCSKKEDCQGTEEEPVYDLSCYEGECKHMGTYIQCAGYGMACERDSYKPATDDRVGCCDSRLRCAMGYCLVDPEDCLNSGEHCKVMGDDDASGNCCSSLGLICNTDGWNTCMLPGEKGTKCDRGVECKSGNCVDGKCE